LKRVASILQKLEPCDDMRAFVEEAAGMVEMQMREDDVLDPGRILVEEPAEQRGTGAESGLRPASRRHICG
jgi:hypothetical protein